MNAQVKATLERHNIEVEESAGAWYAKEWYMLNGVPDFEYVDITNWTIADANAWLGY